MKKSLSRKARNGFKIFKERSGMWAVFYVDKQCQIIAKGNSIIEARDNYEREIAKC
jgi:hypothetical protein